ncbi:MAG: hypothetical protein ABJD57_10295, partial [Roseibium sp.]
VHPDLYHKVKIFGSDPVENVFHSVPDMQSGAERDIIDEAYSKLGHLSAGRLVSATHHQGGAWDLNYQPGVRHCIIPNEDILNEYRGTR